MEHLVKLNLKLGIKNVGDTKIIAEFTDSKLKAITYLQKSGCTYVRYMMSNCLKLKFNTTNFFMSANLFVYLSA